MAEVLSYRERDASVAVSWSLPDLPTSLHKAGLAGLLCYVKKMPEIAPQEPAPTIETATPVELRIRFTEESLQALMDSVYAGEKHLVESKTKWTNGDLKEERTDPPRHSDDKATKVWVYEVNRPKADLMVHWRHGDPEDRWVVLWREAVRGVLRESRAAEIYHWTTRGKSPTKQSGDLSTLWKGLVTAAKGRRSVTGAVPTSMYIGAEKKSADRVDFKGEVQQNLLLHFWPFVSPIFVPRTLRRQHGQWKLENGSGFVIAVAEVGHITEYSEMIDFYWRRRQMESSDGRRRPRECEIDIPAEGGVAFLHSLTMNRLQGMDDGDFFDIVPHVDIYHLERRGNNVRVLESSSICVPAGTLRRYERMTDLRRNVLFKRLLMRNLLDGLPWHARAVDTLFTRYPVGLFINSETSPGFARGFGRATREQFRKERSGVSDKLNLAAKVFDIVGEFVAVRAERRSSITREQLPKDAQGRTDWNSQKPEMRRHLDAREKVATDAFLALRSRNADEFVEYFVGAICAVPQFMGATGVRPREGFVEIASALHGSDAGRTEMKNLTMLALSAHGSRPWRSSPSSETNTTPGGAK